MRVLHVCGPYIPATEWGGSAIAVAAYAEALSLTGAEVEVFATTARASPRHPPIAPGRRAVRGVPVTYFRAPDRFRSFVSPAMALELARRVPEFDVIHLHVLWAFPGNVAARIAARAGVPFIVTPHGSLNPWALAQWKWMKRAFLALLDGFTLRRAALVHYTAEAERTAAPPAFRQRAAVVPNVVDPAPFAALRPHEGGASQVLSLGRIHAAKGFDLLIPAMRRVLQEMPRAELVVAGPDEGGYQRAVQRLAADAGVASGVRFTGLVEGEGRARVLEEAALLVAASHSENFGLAVAEGMASGLPVVVTDTVNIQQDVAAAGAGLVVRRDADELASAILSLLRDPTLRRRMGARGRALVQDRYSPARVGEELRRMYERAIAAGAAPAASERSGTRRG